MAAHRFRRPWPLLAAVTCFASIGSPARAQVLLPQADHGRTPGVPPAEDRPTSGEGRLLPGFRDVFKEVGEDFTRFPSRENLTWLGVGAGLSLLGHTEDGQVSRSPAGSHALEAGEIVGGMLVQGLGAMATYALGRVTDKPKVAEVGADLIRAQILSQAVTQAIKFSTLRTRPDGSRFSFPSGHTASTFASATVLYRHFGWKAGVPAYAVASYVAASRIQTKRHFLSDIVFGAALGIVSGRTVTIGRTHKFALAPIATPGGVGVALVHVGGR